MRRPAAYPYYLFLEAALSLAPWLVIALYLVQTVELSPLELVLVGTAMEAAIFVFEVPTGVVADVFGRRRSLLIGWAVMGGATILLGAVPELWAALAGWAIWGFGYTFTSGAFEAWITDEVGADRVGRVFVRGMQVSLASALVGLPLFVGLAAATSLQASVIANGAVTAAVALVSVLLMPETAFRRVERERDLGPVGEMVTTARDGGRLVRARPVLLLLIAAALFAGAYTEGFDRLWEAHFLREVGLPSLGSLDSLWWFALLGVGGMVLALLSSNVLVKRVSSGSQATLARTLLVLTVLQAVTMVAFGLATGFALAVATFLAAQLFRSLARPVYSTWLNQSIDDSSLRATVLSISGQSDAIGQVAGGPGIGALGSAFSIRAALVASGLVLTPAVALFARAVRHHGVEPELDELAEPAAVGP